MNRTPPLFTTSCPSLHEARERTSRMAERRSQLVAAVSAVVRVPRVAAE